MYKAFLTLKQFLKLLQTGSIGNMQKAKKGKEFMEKLAAKDILERALFPH